MIKKFHFLSDDMGIKYLILRDGTVISLSTQRQLSTSLNFYGYPRVILWLNGKKQRHFVHRLVATHFVANPDNLPVVLHEDDDRTNCHADNLRWGTQKENMQDALKKGRAFIGEKNGKSKLTEHQAIWVREALSVGMLKITEIAKTVGVSPSAIYRIKHGITWKHCKAS